MVVGWKSAIHPKGCPAPPAVPVNYAPVAGTLAQEGRGTVVYPRGREDFTTG